MEIVKIKTAHIELVPDSDIKNEQEKIIGRKYAVKNITRDFKRNSEGEVTDEVISEHSSVIECTFDPERTVDEQEIGILLNMCTPDVEVYKLEGEVLTLIGSGTL